jgi:hypothetical protein
MKTCFSMVFLLTALLLSAETARACSFRPTNPLYKEFADAENVAIMKLTAVTKTDGTEEYPSVNNIKQSTLRVEKVYKGKLKVGQELPFMQGGGADCIWTFSEEGIGTEYLLFLFGDKGIWAVSVCSRSNTVEGAAADIRYLENIATLRRKTRIYGTLEQEFNSPVEIGGPIYWDKPLAGKTVRITGMGRDLRVKTDAEGFYEVYGLPPGRYRIEPEKVKGFRPQNDDYEGIDSVSVELFSRSHAEANFEFEIDNSISGRLLDHDGKPLAGVWIYLLPARGEPSLSGKNQELTGKDGSFKFDEVDEGSYVMLLNDDGEITAASLYPTFYYPGTIKREEATEIKIGPGDFLANFTLKAPPPAGSVTISGRLLWEDGSPAADQSVDFRVVRPPEAGYHPQDATGRTAKDGRFSIKVLRGQQGALYGTYYASKWDFEGCPGGFEAVKARVSASGDIVTPRKKIDASGDIPGVELRLPVSICKKGK